MIGTVKLFDTNYKLLDEMYRDDYYPTFLVDKVKDELQKVIDLLEGGETDTEVVSVVSMTCRRNLTRMTVRLKQSHETVLE